MTEPEDRRGALRQSIRLVAFLRRLDVEFRWLLLSVLLLAALAFVQIYTIQVLYLLIGGLIHGDFGFVLQMRGVGIFARLFAEPSPMLLFLILAAWNYLLGVSRSLLLYSGQLMTVYQAQKASAAVRKLIFARYLQFGKMFFDRNNVGGLSHLMIDSTRTITSQIAAFQLMLTQLVTLAVYVMLMCWYSWQLTLATVAIFPLAHYASVIFTRRLGQQSLTHQTSLANLSGKAYDLLTCIPLIKGYAKEEEEKRLFDEVSNAEISTALDKAKSELFVTPIEEICQTTALLLAAVALAYVGAHQHLDASRILVFFFMTNRAASLVNALNSFNVTIAGIEGPLRAIEELLSPKDKFIVPEGNRTFNGLQRCIEFRHLEFSYLPQEHVLRDVSFSLRKGQMLAVVGATGAGKTTLVNLLLRFYDCPPASILLDGVDIRDFTIRSLRDRMAFVSQDIFLLNDTLRTNLAYALTSGTVTDDFLLPILKKARLYEFVKSLPEGLDTVAGDRGVRLSGGEKQRVALARALLKNAEILILDEATSSLDSVTELQIQQALEETTQGRTTIVIAHRLSTIRHADQIVLLDRGRVVEAGTLNELLSSNGEFRRFWDAQGLGRQMHADDELRPAGAKS